MNNKQTDKQTDGAAIAAAPAAPTITYGAPIISRAKSNAVYPARFGGGKSTKAIEVAIPIPALGMVIETTIYSRLEEKPEGTTITTSASKPKGISFESDAAEDAFLGLAERGAMLWPGYDLATVNAEARLLGTVPAPIADRPDVTTRPRLVKRVTGAQTAAVQ